MVLGPPGVPHERGFFSLERREREREREKDDAGPDPRRLVPGRKERRVPYYGGNWRKWKISTCLIEHSVDESRVCLCQYGVGRSTSWAAETARAGGSLELAQMEARDTRTHTHIHTHSLTHPFCLLKGQTGAVFCHPTCRVQLAAQAFSCPAWSLQMSRSPVRRPVRTESGPSSTCMYIPVWVPSRCWCRRFLPSSIIISGLQLLEQNGEQGSCSARSIRLEELGACKDGRTRVQRPSRPVSATSTL